jgi:hypothetical protein
MADSNTEILFNRESKAYADGSVPGVLTVQGQNFPTIERGNNFVSLKIGKYKMKHSKKNRKGAPGGTINCLQCMDSKIDQILIHDAKNDSSLNLEGCIAPGMMKKSPPGMGILRSKEAMDKIFVLLGGYNLGNEVTLNVQSNVPGDFRTKESWARLK